MKHEKKTKRIVLGEGTAFGHKHVMESGAEIEFTVDDNNIAFRLNSTATLTHDEHDRIVLNAGEYRSYNQVEFNPFDNSVTRVYD